MTSQLSTGWTIGIIAGYFLFLIIISFITGRDSSNKVFFLADRKSPWILVAIGMIGASLSGVTFISIPGVVGLGGANMNLSYMQMVFGYLLGYFVIATVLMPLYYRLNLTTIYGYLNERFGIISYKTGAGYFLLSRIIGASFRLFLVALVLQEFVMEPLGAPFVATVAITIVLIWVYTFRGGIKTIVWTDTIQTLSMLIAVTLTIVAIANTLQMNLGEITSEIKQGGYGKLFYFDGGWSDPNNFFKQFISGALIALVMTGMDQDMMQKNLTCKTLRDAQKNMFTFSIILVIANFMFLVLGALLYIYVAREGIVVPEKSDLLFPTIAMNHLTPLIGATFILGLIAAAYSSADSALTALTTSFCVDFLDFEKKERDENDKRKIRLIVHLGFSLVLFLVIVVFKALNNDAIINELFIAAGYTYGPILGLFTFGLIMRRKVRDKYVIWICLAAPLLSYIINRNSSLWLDGFEFGFLILALNGILTFLGLLLIAKRPVDE
jgi:Na+/proline symporter